MSMIYPRFFQILIWIFFSIVRCFYLPIYIIRLFNKSIKKCPPITNEISLLSASTLAHRIRQKEIKSEDVVQAYIARIKEVNPLINAVLEERFEQALEDAQKIDMFISKCQVSVDELKEKYPLLGVPITIKGSIAVMGMKHNGGRVDHDVIASTDGVPVQRVRNAGAIPLLRSNIPELCLNWETTNKLIGTTRNPYNSTRTVGGSSGGEASLLTSGASVIGIGSDIAGSLRIPAHFCGIWGHKPSPLLVSEIGHYPDCKQREDWNKVFTLGPLARYASDLRLLLNVIAEPNVKTSLKLNQKTEINKIKIYYLFDAKSPLTSRTNNSVKEAIKKVISYFEDVCGVECCQVEISLLKFCAELSFVKLLFIDDVDYPFKTKREIFLELLKFLMCSSKHESMTIFYGLVRILAKAVLGDRSIQKFNRKLDDLKNELANMLGHNGVFICPSCPFEAAYHGDVYKNVFNYGYLSIFNVLGFPVTNCPIFREKTGLPIGIQVAAGPNMDRLTLDVAEELENAFGGWNPPCDIVDHTNT